MLIHLIRNIAKGITGRDGEALRSASRLLEVTQVEAALDLVSMLLERHPGWPEALRLRGAVQRIRGNLPEAMDDLTLAVRALPDDFECHFELAQCLASIGNVPLALSHCEVARRLAPLSGPVFTLLTRLCLPGEFYFQVLARILDHLSPRTYVEIGVFEGASLRLASTARAVIGIDPEPRIERALEPHMRVFATTSDHFFATHDLRSELGQASVDLAFIDGMHQFEFALRDFANLERACSTDSVILIHDGYPLDEESARREPRGPGWCGDVWRLVVLLKKYRKDLLIHTIGTAPTGLTVIQNLDPTSTFLLDNREQLYKEFLALDYSYLIDDKPGKLNLFPNDWSAIRGMIRRRAK